MCNHTRACVPCPHSCTQPQTLTTHKCRHNAISQADPSLPAPCPQECVSELEALRQARLAYEEELRAAAAEAKRREIQQVRLDAAAYTIQSAWKGLKKKQAAEAKAKGKGKGAKEGAQTASKKK